MPSQFTAEGRKCQMANEKWQMWRSHLPFPTLVAIPKGLLARERRAGPGRGPDVLDGDPGHGRIAGASAADWGAKVDEVRFRAVRMAPAALTPAVNRSTVRTIFFHFQLG